MKKKVLIVLGGVVLVLAVFIWQVVANLDSIVAGVIEDVGSDVLKTEVSVSGVSIDMKSGKAGIAGMTIANPDGYSGANLLEMEGIEVQIDLATIGKDVLNIKSIIIDNPKINFEGTESGGSNIQTLLDNMNSGPSESTESSESEAEAKRMIIDSFQFTGGQVHATSAAKPDEELNLKIPAIKMSGIGKRQGGVTSDVVVNEIANELLNTVIKAAAKAGFNKALEEKKKGFLDKLKGKG